jgi:hypothetical protein
MWYTVNDYIVSWLPCLLDNYWFNMDQQYDIHKSMFTMDWTSFVPFSFFRVNLTVLSALLRFTNFDYAFGIFKLILFKLLSLLDKNNIHTLPLNLKAICTRHETFFYMFLSLKQKSIYSEIRYAYSIFLLVRPAPIWRTSYNI